jgi:hypothetical protein
VGHRCDIRQPDARAHPAVPAAPVVLVLSAVAYDIQQA